MFADTIAFVAGEAILRILCVERGHETVAGDFGDDAGRGDAEAECVAGHQCGVRDGKPSHGEAVDQRMVGFARQGRHGAGHGEMRGAEDIEAVDLRDVRLADAPMDVGADGEHGMEMLAFFGGQFFRVIQALDRAVIRQNDSGGDHGAGERTASGFIDPGDQKNPASAQGTLAGKVAGHGKARERFTPQLRWRGLFPSPWWRICLCACAGN